MNFGLEPYIPYVLYLGAVIALLLSIFWRPSVGLFYLLPLIPLQTLRYRLNDLPMGASVFGILLVGVAVGQWRTGQPVLLKTPWTRFLAVFAVFTFASLCFGSLYLKRPMPLPGDPRFNAWQEYMTMPVLLLLVASVAQSKRQILAMVLVMCMATLVLDKSFWNEVSGRDYSMYTEDLHSDGGSMGYAGANGLAAFAAQATAFLLALAGFERRTWIRAGYYGISAFSAICLMYSLSRGGYAAFLAGCLVIGLLKQRKILVLAGVFLFTWTTLVPPAVEQRVAMTYDAQNGAVDNSSRTRLSLWSNAMNVYQENPVWGTGFDTYEYMHLNRRTDGFAGYYADTHNYFVKVLVETGAVGFLLFLWLLGRIVSEGYRLFRRAHDPFFKSLGLGVIGWLVCTVVANLFGDRWTFLQVNGYMWVIAGLVCRAFELEKRVAAASSEVIASTLLDTVPDVPLAKSAPLALAATASDSLLHSARTRTESNSYRL
jgi:putative inorganic carbon (HCO3(-)) transporter